MIVSLTDNFDSTLFIIYNYSLLYLWDLEDRVLHFLFPR